MDVAFFCRLARQSGADAEFRLPITDFAAKVLSASPGREAVRPMIHDGEIVPRRIRNGPYVAEVVQEVQTFGDFISALLDGGGITVAEFVQLMNQALARAALRSDIPLFPTITTRLDPEAPLYQDGVFNIARADGRRGAAR
jgi:hypothetical protein